MRQLWIGFSRYVVKFIIKQGIAPWILSARLFTSLLTSYSGFSSAHVSFLSYMNIRVVERFTNLDLRWPEMTFKPLHKTIEWVLWIHAQSMKFIQAMLHKLFRLTPMVTSNDLWPPWYSLQYRILVHIKVDLQSNYESKHLVTYCNVSMQ